MLSVTASFAVFFLLAMLAACIAGSRSGARTSLGVGMAASLLAATWFLLDIAGTPLRVSSAVAAVLLIGYCVHSGKQIFSNWGLLDGLIGGMMLWHIVVDSYYGGFDVSLVARAYGEWVLPYVAGRFAVMHHDSIAKLAPWFVITGIVIASAAIFETVTQVNAWEALFHVVDDDVPLRPKGVRYGVLHRAIGPTRHPIFLGIVMLTLIPWAIGLISTANQSKWRVVAGVLGLGSILACIIATGSRGPLLALVFAAMVAAALTNRVARWITIAIVALCVVVAVTRFDQVSSLLDANMDENARGRVVVVDGEAEVYTGTKNRAFVVRIYGPIAIKGGLLGYGSANTDEFPPNVPGLPRDPKSRQRLRIVDNCYILIALRFGLIGGVLFSALLACGIWKALDLRRTADTFLSAGGRVYVSSLACIFVAISIELTTVFGHYDFLFWVLFSVGTVAGHQAFSTRLLRGQEEAL